MSKTQKQIARQINHIYLTLIKLGYPKILQLTLQKYQEIQTYLSPYFQSTPSRLQLLQWLVAIVFPQYRQMQWYITEKDNLKRLTKCLWKIGVMPVNKHTKNLDYVKYVQGMLGYENAVGLIFNLVELAIESVLMKKSKQDVLFGQFFHQLVDNFTELVNQNFDVYGITFPCKFINPNPQTMTAVQKTINKLEQQSTQIIQQQKQQYLNQFQTQYKQFYQKKMIPLLNNQDQIFDKIYKNKKEKNFIEEKLSSANKKNKAYEEQQNNQAQQSDLARFIDTLNKKGKIFNVKYNNLLDKIQQLLQKPQTKSLLIPHYINKKEQKQQQIKVSHSQDSNINLSQSNDFQNKSSLQKIKQDIQKRSIKISVQFCQKYKSYKKLIRQIKTTKDDQQFFQQRKKILDKLAKINQNICI